MTLKTVRIVVSSLLVVATVLTWAGCGQIPTPGPAGQIGRPTNPPEPILPPASASAPIPLAGDEVLFQEGFGQPGALAAWQSRFLSPDTGHMATWQLRQEALYLNEGAGGMQIIGMVDVVGQDWQDFVYGVDIYPLGNLEVGAVFRYQDGSFYRFRFLSSEYRGRPTLLLERVSGEQVTLLTQADGPGYELEHWYNVQIAAVGPQLTVYLDGQPVLQASDDRLSQGGVGVYALSLGYTYFDNVRVTSVRPAPAPVLAEAEGNAGAPPVVAVQPDTPFTPPYNISNSADPYNNTQHPKAAFEPAANLHVTWMEGSDDPYPKDNGPAYVKGWDETWPAWEWAGPHLNDGYTNPAIALDSAGTVHLVWGGSTGDGGPPYDIWYAQKPAGGSWSAPENISYEGDFTVYPDIAIDSQDRIWVVWQVTYYNGDTDINARSRPAGEGWGPVMAVAASGQQDQNAAIAIDGYDVPHVVWRNNSYGNWEILYSKYEGGSWTPSLNISQTPSGSHYADIAASGGNLYVVWEDDFEGPDEFEILFTRWNGSYWRAWEYVSSTSKALYPRLSLDNERLYVAWEDYRSGSRPETYFSHSTDGGTTWLGDENVSQNGTSSYYPDVVAQPGGVAHVFWEDMAPGQLDIFYSQAGTPPVPPQGQVDILAQEPPGDPAYTRLLTVTLQLSATSPAGYPITHMRLCNEGACSPLPDWIPFATTVPSWPLLNSGSSCEPKSVRAWFRDGLGQESGAYTDSIRYDDYLTASMALNGGNAYTNRLTVTVNSVDRDAEQPNCSGLQALQLSADGVSYTPWMTFSPDVEYALPASGPSTRTVYAQYRDRAGNVGTFSDQIALDTTPPYSATPPTLPASTTLLLVPISGLEAYDDHSGVAQVWMANRPAGPWKALSYQPPPHTYTWCLGYGGPPLQVPFTHTVYVKYEDASGYGPYPGNFSEVVSGTILVSGISNLYLPLVAR